MESLPLDGYRSFLAGFLKSVEALDPSKFIPFVYADKDDLKRIHELGLSLRGG